MTPGPRSILPGPRRHGAWLPACAVALAAAATAGACKGPSLLPQHPLLEVQPLSVTFLSTPADPGPDSRSIDVLERRGYPLASAPTIAVEYQGLARGWLRWRVTGRDRVFSVVLDTSADEGLLPPGTYTASLLIDAKEAEGVPATVTVTLTVE